MGAALGQSVAQSIMMQLGSFQFGIATAAYQELRRRTEYRWPSQDLYDKLPALQYTGPGQDTITLTGVIYTEYVGTPYMLAKMRALASRGLPLPLTSGAGSPMGRWVIESVDEGQSVFMGAGVPRKQEFTLQLKLFDREQAEQTDILKAVVAAASGVPSTATPSATAPTTVLGKVQASVGGFLSNAAKTASDMVRSTTSALQAVQEKAGEIGAVVGPVVSGVQTAVSTARNLQSTVNTLKLTAGNISSLSDVTSVIDSVSSVAGAASNAGSLASAAAKTVGVDLSASGASADTISAVKECQAACGRAAVEASGIYSQGNSILKDARSLFAHD
jgi:phage protein U